MADHNINATINTNIAECIKVKSHLGYDVVHNICNGNQQILQWGIGDYMGTTAAITAIIGMIILIVLFALFVYRLAKDDF